MKNYFILLIPFFLLNFFVVEAQNNGQLEEKLVVIQEKMELDEASVDKILAIYTDYKQQLIDLNKKSFNKIRIKKQAERSIIDLRKLELMDVLESESRFKKFQEYLREEFQKDKPRDLSPEEKRELGQKVRSYNRENVFPFFEKERSELEKKMSEDDRQSLDEIREAMLDKSSELKEQKNECTNIKAKSKESIKCRMAIKSIEKELKAIQEQLDQFIAEKESILNPYLTKFSDERADWVTDINNIIAAYFNTTAEDTFAYEPKANIFLQRFTKKSFVLTQPDKLNEWLLETNEILTNSINRIELFNIDKQLFLISNEKATEELNISLYDINGMEVKKLNFSDSNSIDLSDLPNGLYTYSISSNGDATYKKILLY